MIYSALVVYKNKLSQSADGKYFPFLSILLLKQSGINYKYINPSTNTTSSSRVRTVCCIAEQSLLYSSHCSFSVHTSKYTFVYIILYTFCIHYTVSRCLEKSSESENSNSGE